MSRLLVFGDVHLGAGNSLGREPGDRLTDQETVLHRIVKLALAEKVDGVLFAGDAFHGEYRRRPTPEQMLIWRSTVEALGDEGIGVLAIAGNHDVATGQEPSALEVIRGASGGYYNVLRRPGLSLAFDGLAVACLPWASTAWLAAQRNGDSRDALVQEAGALLVDAARDLREEIALHWPDRKAILLAHYSVSGAALPNGLPTDMLREPVLPLADLEALGFDAVCLGHIHRAQMLSPGPLDVDANGSHVVRDARPIFYTGSTAVVDWGETSVPHGCWLLDTEGPSLSFQAIEDRPFYTLDYDFTAENLYSLDDEIARSHWREAVVRVRYTATEEQARRIDEAQLRGALDAAGAIRVFIQPTIVRETRARVEGADETLAPLEALDLYIEHHFQEIPSPRADEMRTRTAGYLQEVGT